MYADYTRKSVKCAKTQKKILLLVLYYVEQEVGSRREESLQALAGLSVNRHGYDAIRA